MSHRWWRFGWDSDDEEDFTGTSPETLTQAIRAASWEEEDGSVQFGTLRGTVVGLRYYTGVVRMNETGMFMKYDWLLSLDFLTTAQLNRAVSSTCVARVLETAFGYISTVEAAHLR